MEKLYFSSRWYRLYFVPFNMYFSPGNVVPLKKKKDLKLHI